MIDRLVRWLFAPLRRLRLASAAVGAPMASPVDGLSPANLAAAGQALRAPLSPIDVELPAAAAAGVSGAAAPALAASASLQAAGEEPLVLTDILDPGTLRHEAVAGDPARRAAVAGYAQAPPDLLSDLAGDEDADVRSAAVRNKRTPARLLPDLADDPAPSVRLALIERLGALLPDLAEDQRSELYHRVVAAFERLAVDRVVEVRAVLANTLKDTAFAPPKAVLALARDVERRVAAPMLQACLALSDEQLIEIVQSAGAGWVSEAVAARRRVSAPLADMVARKGSAAASLLLLENDGAILDAATLDQVARQVLQVTQEAAAPPGRFAQLAQAIERRRSLAAALEHHAAPAIDMAVREALFAGTAGLDAGTRADVKEAVWRRLAFGGRRSAATGHRRAGTSPRERVDQLVAAGRLDETAVLDALALNDRATMVLALARLARVPSSVVERILAAGHPKPVVALAHRAGLSMRAAMQLQLRGANVPPRALINARHGTDYPFTPEEMDWQMSFFGVE